MGKSSDLTEFERGKIIGARLAGASISETANLVGFSRATVSRVYREWYKRGKTSSERGACGRKQLVDESGQKRMSQIVESNSRCTVEQITAEYNAGASILVSERTTRRCLARMGYYCRRPVRMQLFSEINRKKEEFFVDMTCEGCSGAVNRVLSRLEGVQYEIDLPNKKVVIQSENHTADQLLETLKKTGKEARHLCTK
ncbi:copper transport protein ATOX1 isoform X1 [Eleutherodactylus coqui]|uniref:copper transport protein ATOX1 isoform X1 n=1 Tax=Eleutherodactylus coqui TaxID=57060 RepID=UPI0034632251